jgi:hypothetical protein
MSTRPVNSSDEYAMLVIHFRMLLLTLFTLSPLQILFSSYSTDLNHNLNEGRPLQSCSSIAILDIATMTRPNCT